MATQDVPVSDGTMTATAPFGAGLRRTIATLCWTTLIFELLFAMAVRMGDELVIPTLAAYGPRWICLIPVILLCPAVLLGGPRTLAPLIAAALVAVGPGMQFEIATQPPRQGSAEALTVVSFNAGRHFANASLAAFADAVQADLVAVQECPVETVAEAFRGWTVRSDGSLCLVSRFPIGEHELLDRSLIGGYHSMMLIADVETPAGPLRFFNVHLETVREGIEALVSRQADGIDEMRANLAFRDLESRVLTNRIAETPGSFVVAGDFNMPDDSAIYRSRWGRWSNAFATAGWGFGYTKYTHWWGIRIDHVLYSNNWRAVEAGPGIDLGSDHRPMVAMLEPACPNCGNQGVTARSAD